MTGGRALSGASTEEDKEGSELEIHNIRTRPLKVYDNITRSLLKLGITLSIITFVGMVVRYGVQEFDPTVSTITVTTSRVNDRDIASLSVSKNFLERILEFCEQSIAIVASIIPIGFPLCSLFNRRFARMRAAGSHDRMQINDSKVLDTIPRYVVIGDSQACQLPDSSRLRPLVRDTIYQMIRIRLKPKLVVEDSYEEARELGIRLGLIRRQHHRLAVIKSVDLLKNITDSRGNIKQAKVRYLLSRMKIMAQARPSDKSLLIYLIKFCEPLSNENLAYLGYSFTDPEAMRLADCSLTFQDCDDDDVKKSSQVLLKSASMTFSDLYLFLVVCLISSNITQSFALYQISASVCSCVYRFLSITVFQEQLISHSQFSLLMMLQQVFAMAALMTKWLSSLAQAPLAQGASVAASEMSHEAFGGGGGGGRRRHECLAESHRKRAGRNSPGRNGLAYTDGAQSLARLDGPASGGHSSGRWRRHSADRLTAGEPASDSTAPDDDREHYDGSGAGAGHIGAAAAEAVDNYESSRRSSCSRSDSSSAASSSSGSLGRPAYERDTEHWHRKPSQHAPAGDTGRRVHSHLSGINLDEAVINSGLVAGYRHTFRASKLLDDVTYRLVKLHIAYQVLVMIIIMIFGNAMFQLNMENNRQHQTLAFNSLMMNNIFNLANCFNQVGLFNVRAGFRSHPFSVCVLLLALFVQVSLTELNAFGLENLNPIQWFVCLVFAFLSALIAPLTGQGQQRRRSRAPSEPGARQEPRKRWSHQGRPGASSGSFEPAPAAHGPPRPSRAQQRQQQQQQAGPHWRKSPTARQPGRVQRRKNQQAPGGSGAGASATSRPAPLARRHAPAAAAATWEAGAANETDTPTSAAAQKSRPADLG